MLRMKVKALGIDQNTMVPVVVITDLDETGFIPIAIGPAEAQAIGIQMEGMKPPRPLSHDLLKSMLDTLNTKVDRVTISEVDDEKFFATIRIKNQDGEIELDARPSDAIALALRADSPIYVSDAVAAKAFIATKPIDDEEMDAIRRFLQNASPADFEQPSEG